MSNQNELAALGALTCQRDLEKQANIRAVLQAGKALAAGKASKLLSGVQAGKDLAAGKASKLLSGAKKAAPPIPGSWDETLALRDDPVKFKQHLGEIHKKNPYPFDPLKRYESPELLRQDIRKRLGKPNMQFPLSDGLKGNGLGFKDLPLGKSGSARPHTENRQLKIKLASAILNLDAIQRELSKYDTHRLFKSAAVGAHKAERMKVAALVRQQEIEKQAIGAFLGKLGLGAAKMGLKGLGGAAKGAAKTVGAGTKMMGQGARGAVQGARGAVQQARKPGGSLARDLGAGAKPGFMSQAKGVVSPGAHAKGIASKAKTKIMRNTRAAGNSQNYTGKGVSRVTGEQMPGYRRLLRQRNITPTQARAGATKNIGGALGEMGRGAAAGARQGVGQAFGQAPVASSAALAGAGALGAYGAKQGIQAGAGALGQGAQALGNYAQQGAGAIGNYAQQGAGAIAKPLQNFANTGSISAKPGFTPGIVDTGGGAGG